MYRILYKFCSQIQNKKDEIVQGYNYAKNKIKIINDPKFIQKTIKQEHLQRPQPYHLSSLQFPVLLCSSVLFLYHLWQVMPYSKIFQHTSISDQTEKLIYPIMLSPITLQNHKQLLLYFPFLIYGIFLNGKYMNTKGLLGLYFLNSIICSGFTYYYQKESSKQKGLDVIIPKTIGACTPLAYVASFIAINPKHLMFKRIPFSVLGILLLIYEIEEYLIHEDETCRPAHLSAIIFGAIYGLAFKKMCLKNIYI